MFSVLPFTILLLSHTALAAPTCRVKSKTASATATASSSVASATSTSTSGSTSTDSTLVSAAWFPNWLGLSPSNISWSQFNLVTYSFALTTEDVSTVDLDADPSDLQAFVTAAHENDATALLTIGGWSGSRFFSTAVGSAENRTAFVKTVVDLVNTYNLDGIDFDWEYPGKQGIGCNVISTSDTENYLSFLQELRQDDTGKDMYISAAVALTPFAGADGTPSTDVSAFGDIFDHIAIMNYDVFGSWSSTVGPNAPLNDTCATDQEGSAVSAVKAWTDAGFPVGKIVLGVPAYTHTFTVPSLSGYTDGDKLTSFPPFTGTPQGDSSDAASTTDVCGNTSGYSGIYTFASMVQEGLLNSDGSPASGMDYFFDDCSQTPFLYDSSTEKFISYDNAQSFQAKGEFIVQTGLKGFAMWSLGDDYNDILSNAINDALDA